jgi:hypothetical protein
LTAASADLPLVAPRIDSPFAPLPPLLNDLRAASKTSSVILVALETYRDAARTLAALASERVCDHFDISVGIIFFVYAISV